jgi:hypothetical protein
MAESISPVDAKDYETKFTEYETKMGDLGVALASLMDRIQSECPSCRSRDRALENLGDALLLLQLTLLTGGKDV